MNIVRLPSVAPYIYRSALFRLNCNRTSVCLTFDDGPHPDSTPEILDLLEKYSLRALFFCTGKNAASYPELMKKIKNAGHIIGNHSYSHYDGLFTSSGKYLEDVEKASALTSSSLFRPPYGRMRLRQYSNLKRKYTIVLWDLMAEDYKQGADGKKITGDLLRGIRPGSIIVFHDRPDCLAKNCLEEFISGSAARGYEFVLP